MVGTLVDVDTDDFVTASSAASTAAASVRRARDTARSAMSGLAQMGGTDPSGVKWSTSYDKAALQAFTGLDGLVGGLGMVAAGLAITGNNYATADWHSAGHAGTPPGCVTPTVPVGECTAPPPSASGGSRTSPIPGFHYVADFIGDLWPDGDPGKLRQASSAWSALAGSLDTVAGSGMARVTGALAGSTTPEMPAITDTVGRVRSNVSEVARECRAFASACAKFADQIDDVHKRTWDELNNLVLQIEATAAVSIGLTVFTAGISDAVGAGAVAAEVGFSVTRILAFIAQLARDVVAVVDEIGVAAGTFTKAIGLSEKVGVRLVAVTSKSVAYGVEGAGVNVTVQAIANPGSDLSDAATQGFIGGAAFGVLGETAGAVGRAAGARAAARVASNAPRAEAGLAESIGKPWPQAGTKIDTTGHWQAKPVDVAEGSSDLGKVDFGTSSGEAVFWTGRSGGIGGSGVSAGVAKDYGSSTLEMFLNKRELKLPAYDKSDPAVVAVWDMASRKIAQGAKGDVHVMLGDSLRPGNTWERIELPALIQNHAVTSITSVDPLTGVTTKIWTR